MQNKPTMENPNSLKRSNNTNKSDNYKLPRRKSSSHTRRFPQESVINMAEARREIVHALNLHRSSSSRVRSTVATGEAGAALPTIGNRPPAVGSLVGLCGVSYSLTESMPLPEPIWSTTAPSIPVEPPAPTESLECFEWGGNQAAAYAWWLGFLKMLDGKNICNNIDQNSRYPSSYLEKIVNGKLGEGIFMDASDQNTCTDEWLIFPAIEDEGENER